MTTMIDDETLRAMAKAAHERMRRSFPQDDTPGWDAMDESWRVGWVEVMRAALDEGERRGLLVMRREGAEALLALKVATPKVVHTGVDPGRHGGDHHVEVDMDTAGRIVTHRERVVLREEDMPAQTHTQSAAPYDPTRKDWAVITRTHGGTVSVLPNLTLHQAEQAAKRLEPSWFRPGREGQMFHLDHGTIVDVSIIGPEGWHP